MLRSMPFPKSPATEELGRSAIERRLEGPRRTLNDAGTDAWTNQQVKNADGLRKAWTELASIHDRCEAVYEGLEKRIPRS